MPPASLGAITMPLQYKWEVCICVRTGLPRVQACSGARLPIYHYTVQLISYFSPNLFPPDELLPGVELSFFCSARLALTDVSVSMIGLLFKLPRPSAGRHF